MPKILGTKSQSCPLNPLLTLSDSSRISLNICQTIYDLLESFFITHKNSMNVFAFGRLGTVGQLGQLNGIIDTNILRFINTLDIHSRNS